MKYVILLIVFLTYSNVHGVVKPVFKHPTLTDMRDVTVIIRKRNIEYLPIAIPQVPIDCRHLFYLCMPLKKIIWPSAEPHKPLNIRKNK